MSDRSLLARVEAIERSGSAIIVVARELLPRLEAGYGPVVLRGEPIDGSDVVWDLVLTNLLSGTQAAAVVEEFLTAREPGRDWSEEARAIIVLLGLTGAEGES